MSEASRQTHWENVYTSKGEAEVSWFQDSPSPSLELLELVGATPNSKIIDIGGGASRLVDVLLANGYRDLTVLDLSEAALMQARKRIGDKADQVSWVAQDITAWQPQEKYDVWHDRAAFHFLTGAADQAAYIARLNQALKISGHVIIGTFALDGPEKCSGLPVARQDSDTLSSVLGSDYVLVDNRRHDHITPMRTTQKFQFSTFRRK